MDGQHMVAIVRAHVWHRPVPCLQPYPPAEPPFRRSHIEALSNIRTPTPIIVSHYFLVHDDMHDAQCAHSP